MFNYKKINNISLYLILFTFITLQINSCTTPPTKNSGNRLDSSSLEDTKNTLKENATKNDDSSYASFIPKSGNKETERAKLEKKRKKSMIECEFSYDNSKIPLYLPDQQVIISNVKPLCQKTEDGTVSSHLYYTVMGIPCSGELGNMKVQGGFYSPKMISYTLDTSCKMISINPEALTNSLKRQLNITDNSVNLKLVAYNPLEIRYWQIQGWQDSGVDSSIDFRSLKIKEELWSKMRDHKASVDVDIYGRENSWGNTSTDYLVNVNLNITNVETRFFKIKINSVSFLDKKGINKLQKQCASSRKNKKVCFDI